MNILSFLIPKSEVAFIYEDYTVFQSLKKIRHSGYTAIPIITKKGKYLGSITEGDFLWSYIDIHKNFPLETIKNIPVTKLKRRFQYDAVNVNADLEHLLGYVYAQNFVPIVDDRGIFIGIVTRQDVMKHYCNDLPGHQVISY